MSRNMTPQEIALAQRQIASARSISDVLRVARVVGGYRFTWASDEDPTTELTYTYDERAWFRRPLGNTECA